MGAMEQPFAKPTSRTKPDASRRVDVAVVGGGPAGAAAALTLTTYTTRSVALVERSGYEGWRVGESLSPAASPLLQYLGAWDAFQDQGHIPVYGTAAAWGSDALVLRDFLFSGQRPGWHLDRRRFDAGLAMLAAERGAAMYTRTAVQRIGWSDRGRWRIILREDRGAAASEIEARFVVDATGTTAFVARQMGARRVVSDRLMGLVGVFQLGSSAFSRERFTLVEATAYGWWYATRVSEDRMVVALMTDPDILKARRLQAPSAWATLARTTRHLAAHIRGAALLEGPVGRVAHSQILQPVIGTGWLATGEAAAAFDPLSSMGIGYALLSGIEAARATDAALQGRTDELGSYAVAVKRHFERYLAMRRAYYRLERRWPDAPFWLRRREEGLSAR